MQVHAITKNVRMSAQKMREVVRQIQGLPALEAQAVLAAHGYPQLAAVRTEERLVRRTAHVILPFPVLVWVSINVTELDPIETTSSVLWSGEKPRPCTSSSPRD